MKPPAPDALPRHPSVRPPPLRRDDDRPLTVDEFAVATTELLLAFPFAWDATTMQGVAALRAHFPGDWPDALELALSSLPPISLDTLLPDLLARPTERTLPGGDLDLNRLAGRRSALGRLRDVLPDLKLREIDDGGLAALFKAYRKAAKAQSSPMISADLTELRWAVNLARAAVGLPELAAAPRAARPKRRVGRVPQRDLPELHQVDRVLRKCPPELRAFVALRVATTAPSEHLLALRRSDLNLLTFRMTVRAPRSRGRARRATSMLVGLPPWCVSLLRLGLAGVDGWDGDRPLFPKKRGSLESRREFAIAFRKAADDAALPDLTLSGLRRLAQAIHARAPRGVRRATASAGRVGSVLATVMEAYAAEVVDQWRDLHAPPARPRRVPRRAPKHTRPEQRERGAGRSPVAEASTGLPANCIVGASDGPRGKGGRRSGFGEQRQRAAINTNDDAGRWSDEIELYRSAGTDQEDELHRREAEFAVLRERCERAERQVVQLRATTIPIRQAEIAAGAMGLTGLIGGVAIGTHITRSPQAVDTMASGSRKLLAALLAEVPNGESGWGHR